MIFDSTCRGSLVGLSHVWQMGAGLYRTVGGVDASFGAQSWHEPLTWLSTFKGDEAISEVQFWGHGRWGAAKIAAEALTIRSLSDGHAHRRPLDAIRERLTPDAQWWFRTCETFGADAGHAFARAWTSHFGCSAAGHTFIIGYWQSGLHRLSPGETPDWETTEGLKKGTPENPQRALWSRAWAPNTISCLRGSIPAGF